MRTFYRAGGLGFIDVIAEVHDEVQAGRGTCAVIGQHLAVRAKIAREKVDGSGYILLSPASPSYDAFKDFTDRGSQFIKFALN